MNGMTKECKKHGVLKEEFIGVQYKKSRDKYYFFCKPCSYEANKLRLQKFRDAKIKCKNDECNNYAKFKESNFCGQCQYRWDNYKTIVKKEKQTLPDGIVKKCGVHGYLALEDVSINDGFYRCIQCRRDKRRKNYNPKENRESTLKRRFGITTNEYEEILKKQNYVCAICKNSETMRQNNAIQKVRNLAVDHCHSSSDDKNVKIRGLLCGRCNNMIGYSKDNPAILRAGADYLESIGA